MTRLLALIVLLIAGSAAAQSPPVLPGLTINGDNSFSYDDPDDSAPVVTGYLRLPATVHGHAVMICHGKGGSAANFNSQHAANLVQWGFVCIVPQLTHAGSGSPNGSSDEGYCPGNSAIGRACLKILNATPGVDMTRVGMFGHSMGSYFTGGFCGENPSPYPAIRAAVEGAGGCQAGTGSSANALPTGTEVAGITAAMLLFHGTGDPTYTSSQNLQTSLIAHTVPNRLNLYKGVPHGIFDASQKREEGYAISRAWYTQHGVLAFPGNTAPTISAPASVIVTAGTSSSPVAITINDAQTAASSLALQAFSLDSDVAASTTPPVSAYSGLIQNNQISLGGSGSNRTLTLSPSAGKSGVAEIALVVTDSTAGNGQLAAVTYLQVTVQSGAPSSLNCRPDISWIADQRTTPGVAVSNIAFTVTDVETAAGSLSVTATSTNTTVLPQANVLLGGSGSSRTISLTPAAGQSGVSTLTLTVSDGVKTTATAFTLTVAAAVGGNTAPTVQAIAGDTIPGNSVFGSVPLIIKDTEQAENTLTVTAASSNTTLVPQNAIALSGVSYGRTVQVTPASGQSGRVTITLTVSDGTNTSSTAFVLDVISGNAAPVISGLPTVHQREIGGAAPTIDFTVSDAETTTSDLRVTAASSNTTLLPAANIVLAGSGSARTLALTPASSQTGAATVTLSITDGDYTRRAQLLFVVTDPNAASTQFSRPRGVFILDSAGAANYTTTFGSTISLRDGNLRSHAFVDGFTLRVAWDDIESGSTPGQYDFFIIQNLLAKLPAGQRLSLIITPNDPAYIATTPGVQTWNDAGTTRATPWDPYLRARRRAMLAAMGSLVTGGVALRNDPRLDMLDPYLPGGFTGIRDPNSTQLRNLPGYSRETLLAAVQDELRTLQQEFPGKFVQLGFWPVMDTQDASYGNVTAWEWLRQQVLNEFNGSTRPRVGFFMENLAAKRTGLNVEPYSGTPVTGFASALFASRDTTWNGFQMLGSWTRPFNDGHVTNTLYGNPNDAMEYAYNTYRAEYHEVYIGDIDNTASQPALQRWHDFYESAITTSPDSDEDHDGLPLAWEQTHGLNPLLANSQLDDGDHDSIPLLLEYAFHQNPNAPSPGALPVSSTAIHPGDGLNYLLFQYLRRTDAPQLTYTVQVSTTLGVWQSGPGVTQEISAVPTGNGVTQIITVRVLPATGPGEQRFVRLMVTSS